MAHLALTLRTRKKINFINTSYLRQIMIETCKVSLIHVDLTVLSIFQKTVTFDHNMTPFT